MKAEEVVCTHPDARSSWAEALEAALLEPEAAFEGLAERQVSHCFVGEELEEEQHHALEAVLAGCLSSDQLYQSCTVLAQLSLPLLVASALVPLVPVAAGLGLELRCPNLHLV